MQKRKRYKIKVHYLKEGASLKNLLEEMYLIYIKNLKIND